MSIQQSEESNGKYIQCKNLTWFWRWAWRIRTILPRTKTEVQEQSYLSNHLGIGSWFEENRANDDHIEGCPKNNVCIYVSCLAVRLGADMWCTDLGAPRLAFPPLVQITKIQSGSQCPGCPWVWSHLVFRVVWGSDKKSTQNNIHTLPLTTRMSLSLFLVHNRRRRRKNKKKNKGLGWRLPRRTIQSPEKCACWSLPLLHPLSNPKPNRRHLSTDIRTQKSSRFQSVYFPNKSEIWASYTSSQCYQISVKSWWVEVIEWLPPDWRTETKYREVGGEGEREGWSLERIAGVSPYTQRELESTLASSNRRCHATSISTTFCRK